VSSRRQIGTTGASAEACATLKQQDRKPGRKTICPQTTYSNSLIVAGGLIEAAMFGGIGPMTAAAGMAPAAVGYCAKKLSDALTASRVAQLMATIAAGGKAPMSFNPAPGRFVIANALARTAAARTDQ
jgi:hypothetical protein